MKFINTAAAALGLASTTLAQPASKPFYLVLESSNSTLNGKTLDAGHEGAGIEGLLLGPDLATAQKNPQYYTYRFNYTSTPPTNSGVLTWTLVGGNFVESEGMNLYLQPGTNVAIALFEPSDNYQYVSFGLENKMFIQNDYDDTVNPPKDLATPQNLYKWNMCEYNYEGYLYNVLCWSYGIAKPQNPSCQAVNVTRVFEAQAGSSKQQQTCNIAYGTDGVVQEVCG